MKTLVPHHLVHPHPCLEIENTSPAATSPQFEKEDKKITVFFGWGWSLFIAHVVSIRVVFGLWEGRRLLQKQNNG